MPIPAAMRLIPGKAASDGISQGMVQWVIAYDEAGTRESIVQGVFTRSDLQRSLAATATQLMDFQKRIESRIEEPVSELFRAHLAMLTDRTLLAGIDSRIAAEMPVVKAVTEAFDHFIHAFAHSAARSIREKTHDLRDLCRRVIANLSGSQAPC